MSNLPWDIGTGAGELGEGATIPAASSKPMVQSGNPISDATVNRGVWALAEDVRHIWERLKAEYHPIAQVAKYQTTLTSSATGVSLSGGVYCGDATTGAVSDIIKIYDTDGVPLEISGTKITASDVKEGEHGTSVFRAGFQDSVWVEFSDTVPSGVTIVVLYGTKADLDELGVTAMLDLVGYAPSVPAPGIPSYSSMDAAVVQTKDGDIFTLDVHPSVHDPTNSVVWTASTSISGNYEEGGIRIKTNGREVIGFDRTQKYVWAWGAADGSSLWTANLVSNVSAIAIDGKYAYAAIQNGSTAAIKILSLSDGSVQGTMDVDKAVSSTDLVLDMVSDWYYLYISQWISADNKTSFKRVKIGIGNSVESDIVEGSTGNHYFSLDTNGYTVVAAGAYNGGTYNSYLEIMMLRAVEFTKHWEYRVNNDLSSNVKMCWVRFTPDGGLVASYGDGGSWRLVGVSIGHVSPVAQQTWEAQGNGGPISVNHTGVWLADQYGGTPRICAREPKWGSLWLIDEVPSAADQAYPVLDTDEGAMYVLVGSSPYKLRKLSLPVWGGLFRRKVSTDGFKPVPVNTIINSLR